MNKKVLITGSCGFIMTNFVRKIIHETKEKNTKHNYSVSSLDLVRKDNTAFSLYNNKTHTFYPANICDEDVMNTIFAFEKPDIVIHGAAETSIEKSLSDPNDILKTNILGTQNIINNCVKYNVEKLIYLSSAQVYGPLSSEQVPAFSENDPLNPTNPYATSKASAEMLIKTAHQNYGLNYIITRSCNNYGPRQGLDKFIPKIITSIIKGNKIPIYKQGQELREWLHVYDFCSALMKLVEEETGSEIYNISSGQEFSNIEVVQRICNIMGKGHDLIEYVSSSRDAVLDFRSAINDNKIRKLNWSPSFKSLKDGIENTITFYQNNKMSL